jgi:hypothetical protein
MRDFAGAAATYGRLIILERRLPDALKTVKCSGLGGSAGGEKYVVRGIVFKVTRLSLTALSNGSL